MSTNIEHRKVCLVARAAADLHSHATSPYLKITLGDETVATVPDKHHGSNPVYDQQFNISCPGATPNESPMSLRVIAKNTTHLLPDIELGSGVLELHDLFIKGKQEARVPLRDSSGNNAGVAYIGLSVLPEETELPISSAAGTVLGEVTARPPKGAAAEVGHGPETVPTVAVPGTPATSGAALPGEIEDPRSAAYGILE